MLVIVALLSAILGGTFASINDVGSGIPEHHSVITTAMSADDVGSGIPEHR
jgi:ABC-type transporter Mla maintaining outer membrane lipid asymmetry permease subunit MlaE